MKIFSNGEINGVAFLCKAQIDQYFSHQVGNILVKTTTKLIV